MSQTQAGTLATSALLVSSLGGWLAGILADRFGRAAVLRLTIVWFAFFTFLSGFTQSYEQLLFTRSMQGLGFGGEWAAGAVLMSEVIDKRIRGRAVGCVQSGWSVGYGTAVLLFTVVFSVARAGNGVAVPVLPRAASRILRPLDSSLRRGAAGVSRDAGDLRRSPAARFSRSSVAGLRRRTILASMLAAGGLGRQLCDADVARDVPQNGARVSRCSGPAPISGSTSLVRFSATSSARTSVTGLGRRKTFVIMACAAAIVVPSYTLLPLGGTAALLLGFPLGFFQSGIIAGMGATFAELFPTRVRATGQGFSYNTGRAVGSLVPTLVGMLAADLGLGTAMGLCAACAYMLVLIATSMLPETRGRELETTSSRTPRRHSGYVAPSVPTFGVKSEPVVARRVTVAR